MEESNLIFTLSGIRGIANSDLNYDKVKKIVIAYGLLFEGLEKSIIIGRDTRPSGKIIEQAVIDGLLATGFKVTNLGVCPTPIIIHIKNKLKIPAGLIITGSHNPQEWNGLKLLNSKTFLNGADMQKISYQSKNIDLNSYQSRNLSSGKSMIELNPIPNYIQDLYNFIDYKEIKEKNDLRVVIDTGAGTGNYATPQILTEIGCKVKLINNELLVNCDFPREIEPIEKNLKDLINQVQLGRFNVGFAHDTDADRLTIIGENGECYSEDVGLALITESMLKNRDKYDDVFFVTNLASSLMFEAIADKYNVRLIRTPIGERFLTEKMDKLIEEGDLLSKEQLVFGGEGSCGGIMLPQFNNTRDGIFAAIKIVEILVNTGEKISELVSKLPRYFSYKVKIPIKPKNIELIIKLLKEELKERGEKVKQINLDLRFGQDKEWFVLIHPSNTEPVIRVLSEARGKSLARIHFETTVELVKVIISNL